MRLFFAKYPVLTTLLVSSTVSVSLFLVGAIFYSDNYFWFLNWNLFLAWLPLFFAWGAAREISRRRPITWRLTALLLLWLSFLPNSFYLATDLIHLRYATAATVLFYSVMLLSYVFNGFMLGYLSLYMIHLEIIKRLGARSAHRTIVAVLVLCSFAIYLGRYLRWNTWDVVTNPLGLIFDVSDRLINPGAHEQTFRITGLIFLLIGSIYYVIWQLVHRLQVTKRN